MRSGSAGGDFPFTPRLSHTTCESRTPGCESTVVGHGLRNRRKSSFVLRGKNAYGKATGVNWWSCGASATRTSCHSTRSRKTLIWFDFAFDSARELYGSALTTQTRTLLQATDVRKFKHSRHPTRNARSHVRGEHAQGLPKDGSPGSLELDLPLRLIRRGWGEFVPASVVEAQKFILERRVCQTSYRSAEAVLNDHWDSMREHGLYFESALRRYRVRNTCHL